LEGVRERIEERERREDFNGEEREESVVNGGVGRILWKRREEKGKEKKKKRIPK